VQDAPDEIVDHFEALDGMIIQMIR